MSEENSQSAPLNHQLRQRPLPPTIPIPENHAANGAIGPQSPTSPIGQRMRPLPPTGHPPSVHQSVKSPEKDGIEHGVKAEAVTSDFGGSRQRPLPTPQRAFSPPPQRPLPASPAALGSNRPISPPPRRPDANEDGNETFEPNFAPPAVVTPVIAYSARVEDNTMVVSRLGPPPTREAPQPRLQEVERASTPPLPSSPVVQRSVTSNAIRTIDLGIDNSKQTSKAASSSSLFGLLSRPAKGSVGAAPSGSESPSPHGENDKLRVHFKALYELAEGHFASVAPQFNPQAHRDRVGFEIFTSELSYNNFMRILIEVYKTPLLSAQKAGHVQVKEDDAVKVFGPIESVLAVSDIILGALEERIVNWNSETQLIGDVFVKYGDLLKVYATYAREQQNAKIAQSHCTNSKTYHTMLKISQQYPACQSRDLSSLLIMPIQRIPRYELLLRDFIKATPATHPDLPLLNQALAKIKSVAEQVDRSVEEYKQLEKLLAIQASFSGGSNIDLVKPGRRFIREGSLIKVCRRANKTRKFWLFSDVLLYGIPILTGSNVVSGEFSLLHLQLQDLPDAQQPHDDPLLQNYASDTIHHVSHTGTSPSNRLSMAPTSTTKPIWQFMIQSRQKSFVVFANSLQEKADWLVDIMTAVKEFQEAAKSLQTGKGKSAQTIDVAPAWVPDSMAPQCKICSNEFGLVTRRHHCRHCGLVVCDDCSKGRIVLPGLDKHPVRVCNNCVYKLGYGSYDASKGQSTSHASVRYQEPINPPINLLANLPPPPGPSPTSTPPIATLALQEFS